MFMHAAVFYFNIAKPRHLLWIGGQLLHDYEPAVAMHGPVTHLFSEIQLSSSCMISVYRYILVSPYGLAQQDLFAQALISIGAYNL